MAPNLVLISGHPGPAQLAASTASPLQSVRISAAGRAAQFPVTEKQIQGIPFKKCPADSK